MMFVSFLCRIHTGIPFIPRTSLGQSFVFACVGHISKKRLCGFYLDKSVIFLEIEFCVVSNASMCFFMDDVWSMFGQDCDQTKSNLTRLQTFLTKGGTLTWFLSLVPWKMWSWPHEVDTSYMMPIISTIVILLCLVLNIQRFWTSSTNEIVPQPQKKLNI